MTAILLTETLIMADQCVVSMDTDMCPRVDPNHPKIFISPDKTVIIALDGMYDPTLVDTPTFWPVLAIIIGKYLDSVNRYIVRIDQPDLVEILSYIIDESGAMTVVRKDARFAAKGRREDGEKYVEIVTLGKTWSMGCGGDILQGLIAGGLSPSEAFTRVSQREKWCSKEHTIVDLSILEDPE